MNDYKIRYSMLDDLLSNVKNKIALTEFILESSVKLKNDSNIISSKLLEIKGFFVHLSETVKKIMDNYDENILISEYFEPLVAEHKLAFTKFYNIHDGFETVFKYMKSFKEINQKLQQKFRVMTCVELYNKINEFLFTQFHGLLDGIFKRTHDDDKEKLGLIVERIANNIKAVNDYSQAHSNVTKLVALMKIIDGFQTNHSSQILTIFDVEKNTVNCKDVNTIWVFNDKILVTSFVNDVCAQKLGNLKEVKRKYNKYTVYDLTKLNIREETLKKPFKFAQVFCGLNNLNFVEPKLAYISETIKKDQIKKIKLKRFASKECSILKQLGLNITYIKDGDEITLKLFLLPRVVKSLNDFENISTEAFDDKAKKWIPELMSKHYTSDSSLASNTTNIQVEKISQFLLESHEELAIFLSHLYDVEYEKKIIEFEFDDSDLPDSFNTTDSFMSRSFMNDSLNSNISNFGKNKQLTRKFTKSISQILNIKSKSSCRDSTNSRFHDFDQNSITGVSLFEESFDDTSIKMPDSNNCHRTLSDGRKSVSSNVKNKNDNKDSNDHSILPLVKTNLQTNSMSNLSSGSVTASIGSINSIEPSSKMNMPPPSMTKPKGKKTGKTSFFKSNKENTPIKSKLTAIDSLSEKPISPSDSSKYSGKRSRNGKNICHSTPKSSTSVLNLTEKFFKKSNSPITRPSSSQSDDTESVNSLGAPSGRKKMSISTVIRSVRKSLSKDNKST